jgi:hypothetical protein
LKEPEAKAVVEILGTIVSAAAADADAVANHLDHVVDHLMSIGCTSKAAVKHYFLLEKRTLASLYFEAAKAHPSPSQLTRLAVRYALDARRPIEGDIGRFEIRLFKKVWNVIEYPSVAMRTPAIPYPGRIVKNIFATRIFDCLQQRPPDFYRLMELIENLLEGVPTQADCLDGASGADATESQPKIEVNLEKAIVWLDGEPHPVTPAGAYFVDAVISAKGAWISNTEIAKSARHETMVGPRPDRVRARLPEPIRDLIESGGGRGFRLRMT